MSCVCGNKFPRAKVVIRKPRAGTRCSLCCCRRAAFVEERLGGSAVRLCKGCLERALDHYHELVADSVHRAQQRAIAAGHEPQ